MFLACRETTKSCQNVGVHQSSDELLQIFLRLAAKLGSLCGVRPKMTLSGHSAARRKLCGIPLSPCLAEGSPGKAHLIHSDQKATDIFSSLQLMTAGAGICWHLHFTESCEGRKQVPQRVQGEQEAWYHLALGFSSPVQFSMR